MADANSIARASRAAYMREYGRKLGAEPVKGETFCCEVCEQTKMKTGKRQRWCPECRSEGLRRYKAAQRASTGTVAVGTLLTCKLCKTEFSKEHKRQFYCPVCMVLCAKDALPANRARQSKYQAARNKRKRESDASFAIRERMSAQVNLALRGKKAGQSWESIVGYTLADLMVHLERQFLPGMTWANRADWHIDHIVPLTSFTFTAANDPEVARAWALSNLRPLWAADNIRKSGSRTYLI